MTKIRI